MVEMDGPKDCNFDGEDCCGSNVNTQFCSECLCFRYEATPSDKTSAITRLFTILIISISTTTSISFRETCPDRQDWIGDGYCHDGLNNKGCNYDGEDCCGSNVNTQYCSKCQCLGYKATPSDKTSSSTRLFTTLITSTSTSTTTSSTTSSSSTTSISISSSMSTSTTKMPR